jgi:DNA polymerase elongation subunit (family B)
MMCQLAASYTNPIFHSTQRLSKNPEDYTDKKSQPHVQVALRMKQKGGAGKAGEVIPYVFCLGSDGKTSKSAQADHAFHPDEFRRKDSALKIGTCLEHDHNYSNSRMIG